MSSCFVLCFSGKRGTLSEEASCEAVSTLTVTAQALETAWVGCRLHAALGLRCKISDAWFPQCGSGDGKPSDKSQFLLAVAKQRDTNPLWGQTESGDRAVTITTKSWPLLCSVIGVYLYLERIWGQKESVGGFRHSLLARRGPQWAVQWKWTRCLGVRGIWLSTGYIPLDVFISRQQNDAPLHIWSSK